MPNSRSCKYVVESCEFLRFKISWTAPDNQKEEFPWGVSGQYYLYQMVGVGTSYIESGK
jgi:hypothetical protein